MLSDPSQDSHTALGAYGEEIASEALVAAGYQILERNWQAAAGEVDLIAYHRNQLVAIDVKTRAGTGFGDPLNSVSPRQVRRIQRGLLQFKQAVYPRYAHTPLRVDIVGILVDPHGETTAELLQDVT